MEFYNSLIVKVDSKSESGSKVFDTLEEFLGSLKESFSNLNVTSLSLVS